MNIAQRRRRREWLRAGVWALWSLVAVLVWHPLAHGNTTILWIASLLALYALDRAIVTPLLNRLFDLPQGDGPTWLEFWR